MVVVVVVVVVLVIFLLTNLLSKLVCTWICNKYSRLIGSWLSMSCRPLCNNVFTTCCFSIQPRINALAAIQSTNLMKRRNSWINLRGKSYVFSTPAPSCTSCSSWFPSACWNALLSFPCRPLVKPGLWRPLEIFFPRPLLNICSNVLRTSVWDSTTKEWIAWIPEASSESKCWRNWLIEDCPLDTVDISSRKDSKV